MMRYKTRVSTKGQVVIPREMREKYGYDKGAELTITPLDENKLLVERVPRLSELFGVLGDAKATQSLLKEREKEISIERVREVELKKRL